MNKFFLQYGDHLDPEFFQLLTDFLQTISCLARLFHVSQTRRDEHLHSLSASWAPFY